ncbi:class I SAM-dependent methyltransferase [uncultured Draconibacterium sp.]|uniref:class I SAM-dependent methyltransferase n=1 Tax=uncultured Draconibacterium sp. TaxID=1573823 RepID=UPI0029C93EAF|nr:class I SAM-dependent methyltransferase [uncultured Draconibacterium sp.]
MKGTVKAKTVDKYLSSIRLQIVELVEPNSTLIEFGCGNGDLLFKLSNKIKTGVGIDNSEELIEYAANRMKRDQVKNLEFKLLDILNDTYQESEKDYAIASLLLHILPWGKAVELTKKVIDNSGTTIICGFSEPENFTQNFLLWLDQRFTSHFSNFRNYRENGFTEGLLNSIQNIEYIRIDTFDPVIKIYKITKRNKT